MTFSNYFICDMHSLIRNLLIFPMLQTKSIFFSQDCQEVILMYRILQNQIHWVLIDEALKHFVYVIINKFHDCNQTTFHIHYKGRNISPWGFLWGQPNGIQCPLISAAIDLLSLFFNNAIEHGSYWLYLLHKTLGNNKIKQEIMCLLPWQLWPLRSWRVIKKLAWGWH